MKPWLIVLIVVAVLGAAALVLSLLKGPDLRAYLPLSQPRISHKPQERVLAVSFSGAQGSAVQKAFSALMKAYYGLRGVPKGPEMPAPKARFKIGIDLSVPARERLVEFKDGNWQAEVAIPVPDSVTVPDPPLAGGLAPRIATWEYGNVAEILHRGSYDTEPPTIQKLEDFIKAAGYDAVGDHEEEYLRGPGMPFASPKDYWTIIRYRVVKVH